MRFEKLEWDVISDSDCRRQVLNEDERGFKLEREVKGNARG